MERQNEKNEFWNDVVKTLRRDYLKSWKEATDEQLYNAVAKASMDKVAKAWKKTEDTYQFCQLKRVNYLTMEVLPGRALGNNLINTGMASIAKELFDERRSSTRVMNLNHLEEQETDPALGNGGLGRLAACSLESLATQGYNACAYSLRYKKGLFKQEIQDGRQIELPDYWEKDGYPLGIKREELRQTVVFGSGSNTRRVEAVPFDIPIVGYPTHGSEDVRVSTLRLWDAVNEPEITEKLYPANQRLRLKQQYFLVSASIQLIVSQFKKQYKDFKYFKDKVCFHINDTHPVIAIPELMRILMDEEHLSWDEAWEITSQSCSYTNHTIMAEALEKWPIEMFKESLPRVYQIIEEIDRRFVGKLRENNADAEAKVKAMAILYDGQIRMANLAIVGSYSVNGVARLHTEILKKKIFPDFYEIMGEKFNNKTNGVTQRRFLYRANPALSTWISEKCRTSRWVIEMDYIKRLEQVADDPKAQSEFGVIKYRNKEKFANEIRKMTGIVVSPSAIFDVQVKRQHEYKRQLMNVLRIRYLYNKLKSDKEFYESFHPMVFVFAGKAHEDYKRAKLIIQEIHKAADEINNDKVINDKMKVVFLKNYNVSLAEKIFPASDVSEQISTASKEASGTGNMKFMMNGAVTIGTLDGANVEIAEAVGEDNIFIFGKTSEEILALEESREYIASLIALQHEEVKNVVDTLCPELRSSLIYGQTPTIDADQFFVLLDLLDYVETTIRLNKAYTDRKKWERMAIMNIANSGRFSIDRTMREYAKDIWKLESIYED